jgi:hypothetical protein
MPLRIKYVLAENQQMLFSQMPVNSPALKSTLKSASPEATLAHKRGEPIIHLRRAEENTPLKADAMGVERRDHNQP